MPRYEVSCLGLSLCGRELPTVMPRLGEADILGTLLASGRRGGGGGGGGAAVGGAVLLYRGGDLRMLLGPAEEGARPGPRLLSRRGNGEDLSGLALRGRRSPRSRLRLRSRNSVRCSSRRGRSRNSMRVSRPPLSDCWRPPRAVGDSRRVFHMRRSSVSARASDVRGSSHQRKTVAYTQVKRQSSLSSRILPPDTFYIGT